MSPENPDVQQDGAPPAISWVINPINYSYINNTWLVVWNIFYDFHILGMSCHPN